MGGQIAFQLLVIESDSCSYVWNFNWAFLFHFDHKVFLPAGKFGQTGLHALSSQSHLTTCYASRHDKTGSIISEEGIVLHDTLFDHLSTAFVIYTPSFYALWWKWYGNVSGLWYA